jgi:hypothetical protein
MSTTRDGRLVDISCLDWPPPVSAPERPHPAQPRSFCVESFPGVERQERLFYVALWQLNIQLVPN